MTRPRPLFDWKVTRALFAIGTMAVIMGALRVLFGQELGFLWLVLAGAVLIAVATRGPWDSEASGRNRSVLGFRARSKE